MEFEILITLTMLGCFAVLCLGIVLIRQDLDEIKKIIKKK